MVRRSSGPRLVTIMLVPHCGERTYQIRLPVSLFYRLLAVAVLATAILIGFGRSYSTMRENMQELVRLREETAVQRFLLSSVSDQATAIQERESSITTLQEQVRALIEQDAFLPAHLKAQLLANLERNDPGSQPAAAPAGVPAAQSRDEGVSEQESHSPDALPAPGTSPQSLRGRATPLASRAMNRLWGVAAANAHTPADGSGTGDGIGEVEAAAWEQAYADGASDGTDGKAGLSGMVDVRRIRDLPGTVDATGTSDLLQVIAGHLEGALSSGEAAVAGLTTLQEILQDRREMLMSLPQRWPVVGRCTSRFGYRRSPLGRGREFHAGIDLAAPRGTPVRAVADGVVAFAGYKPGLGQTVILDHGHGIRTVYGHHSRLLVRVGQQVRAGQVIAAVGDTGRSTGDHLHFELHFNGREVDPWPYLQRLGGER